jgi:hypothetical protein
MVGEASKPAPAAMLATATPPKRHLHLRMRTLELPDVVK